MALGSGTKLGPYEIASPLGAGGMGEVYRARDTRLDRDVAIKVLPDGLAQDRERVLRFEREAKVLASLNHPNIAAIYGFEEHDHKRLLIMELAEGETLSERLRRGSIPVHDALEIAIGIAVALEAAHEKGIIHRDLKPANVKVTADGAVKVLDFGLAKAMTGEPSATDIANSPTISAEHTRPGVILGTAAYMSPEQARGRPLDKRTDIWSFGALLFECLSGRRAFEAQTTSDVVAKILEREPDWTLLPPTTPPLVQLLLRRCLAKERSRRLRDIGDARVEIESAIHDPTTSRLVLAGAALSNRREFAGRGYLPLGLAALGLLAFGAALGWLLGRATASREQPPVYRFAVDLPADYTLAESGGSGGNDFSAIRLSPDGSTLAFVAEHDGVSRIFVRELAASEARPLRESEGAHDPRFSPDGQWLAFYAGGKLKKAPLAGGPAITICDAPGGDGAWLSDGTFVFPTAGGRSFVRVNEQTGAVTTIASAGITQRTSGGEQPLIGFHTASEVPGADYVIAGIWDGATLEDYATVAVSLRDGAVRPVLQNAIDARYVDPGYLVFLRGASVLAVAFDVDQGRPIGEPRLVVDGVVSSKWADEGQFAVSSHGTLAYVPGGRRGPGRRLIRVDQAGKAEPIMDGTDAIVGGLQLSPDGRRLALITLRRSMELWTFDFARRSLSLVNAVGETWNPVWTPDQQHLVFGQIIPEKFRGMVQKRADGSGSPEPYALSGLEWVVPTSFSPDGKLLLYTLEDVSPERASDVALHRTQEPDSIELVASTPADEFDAAFAPDGKHFAFVSNETGRYEVFVQVLGGGKWQVSQTGGLAPRWSKDGRKLFFVDRRRFMCAVEVDLQGGPRFSTPTKLFNIADIATTDLWGVYDVLPESGFIMVEPADWEKKPDRIHIVTNWVTEFTR